MSVERFSHSVDGFWQDPEGLYVEFLDYEVVEAEAKEAQRKLADETHLRRAFATQRDEAWTKLAAKQRLFGKAEALLEQFVATLSPADQRRIQAAREAAEENSDGD